MYNPQSPPPKKTNVISTLRNMTQTYGHAAAAANG
jgi:hypothetical protein